MTGPLTVLLVDEDEASARRIAELIARDNNLRLQHVSDVIQAETHVAAEAPTVILLSLSAPDLPGLAGVAVIRTAAPRSPIVALVHKHDEPVALKAVHEGCSDYLIRSDVYDTLLIRSLKHAIEKHNATILSAQMERALQWERDFNSALINTAGCLFVVVDPQGRIVEFNHTCEVISGYTKEEVRGRRIWEFLIAPGTHRYESSWVAKDGTQRLISWSTTTLNDAFGNVEFVICTGIEITDQRRAEERLIYNANHDALTGLPNRSLFIDRVGVALKRWRRRNDQMFAVMFLDLDRFKIVNDSLGHVAGDELLTHISAALRTCIRDEDTVARLGGDEFAMLLENVTSRADAILVATRIRNCLQQPIRISSHEVFTTCSVGIALPEDGMENPDDLLRSADLAMYRAKSEGGGRYSIYDASMHSSVVDTMQLSMELHQAINAGEFELHYQPIYVVRDKGVRGFEALLRWHNPRLGMMMPLDFLPLAEETGLILPIGHWVIEDICRQLAQWQKTQRTRQLPFVSVNVSSKQLAQSGFAAEVGALVKHYGVNPSNLMFELTESTLLHNPDTSATTIANLRAMGMSVCIDDFGTGYSSLSYLHRLPINGLKIDRSFISRLDHGEGAEIVSTIVTLANSMGMYAVAEGVETAEQLAHLRSIGPKYVQGYYLSRPVRSAIAAQMLVA